LCPDLFLFLNYTTRSKCWDGVVREFEKTGYFSDLDVFRHWLSAWSYNGYEYFETDAQRRANELVEYAIPCPLPGRWWGTILRYGIQQHDYIFLE